MLWVLLVILFIVLIIAISRSGKKSKYEIQKLKKELSEEKSSINPQIKLFNTETKTIAEVKESEWDRMKKTNTQGSWVLFDEKSHSPSKTSTVSVSDEIVKLKSLLDQGIITQDEFQKQKEKLLQ